MGEFLDSFKNGANDLLRNKKNLISLLVLGILILALPIGINLIRQQQILRSRADVDTIVFTGTNIEKRNGKSIVLDPKQPISLQLTSPLGPPGSGQSSPPTGPTACGTVALSLSPASGNLNLGQNNEIGIKLLPNGCDIVAVEFGLNYVPDQLNVTSIAQGSGVFEMAEVGGSRGSREGGKHYIFTRTPGTSLTQEMIIGKIFFKPPASAVPAAGVFVNIVGIAGSGGLPTITVSGQVSGQGNLPGTQKTVTSGTYNIL